MTTSGESRGSAGRGLPVGWEWRPRTGAWNEGEVDLYPPGADVGEERATVYPSGKWETWEEGHSAQIVAHGTAADGAAAQVAAEAALWATDGYGTGEVRGLRLPLLDISDAAALVASRQTVALPGLSGWWIVRAARCDGGADGIEVDAVRAPVEPAPVIEAGPFCEWDLCRAPLSGPPRSGCGSPYQHDADDDDPAPPPVVSMSPAEVAARDAEALHPDPAIAAEVQADLDEGRAIDRASGIVDGWHKGEPAPRDPSAPTDGAELARLLPGLLDYCAAVLAEPDEDTRSRLGVGKHLARACKLLLAERGRVATLREADGHEVRAWIANAVTEQSRADEAERKLAEVAALQRTTAADLDAARAQLRLVSAGPADVWHWQGDGRDDPASLVCPVVMSADTLREFVAARERVATAERERDHSHNLAVHMGKAFYARDRDAYSAASEAWHEQTKWSDEDRARFAEMLRRMKERTNG